MNKVNEEIAAAALQVLDESNPFNMLDADRHPYDETEEPSPEQKAASKKQRAKEAEAKKKKKDEKPKKAKKENALPKFEKLYGLLLDGNTLR